MGSDNRQSAVGNWQSRLLSFRTIQSASVLLLTVALCVVSAVGSRTFLTWDNLVVTLLTDACCPGIIACGMTLVMIAGGFDLSVASATATCGVVAALLLRAFAASGVWVAIPVALLLTALVGAALGLANGALVSYVGVNPFVVTLSTMFIFRGIALIITGGGHTREVPLALKPAFRQLYWGQVPVFGSSAHAVTVPILVFAGVFLACFYLLRFTRFGHYVYAVGGNENAAWLAGINTRLVKAATYVISGLTCAIAALIYCGIAGAPQATDHQGIEMAVIASVIVGGTPLGGGRGSLLCTLNGLLLLAVIENLLTQFGVREEYRNVVRGTIILVVAAVDVSVRRGQGKRRS
ncbi:MAG: ABC transporter permease [Planctomycetes bacterium]|nr:ABC transporter permease [Planctomycetota bacterium]